MVPRLLSLAFKFVVTSIGWLYLTGLTILLYLTVQNGYTLLIKDTLMSFEVLLMIGILLASGPLVLGTGKKMIQEYLRIIRSSYNAKAASTQ